LDLDIEPSTSIDEAVKGVGGLLMIAGRKAFEEGEAYVDVTATLDS
jgi:uncharacterized protein YbjT (DUF2867 family)